ncbi:ParA family protein [Burkholderia ubonensis]|uniref:ParA family protein n=1 Tax=Burkholderia ubonensis TaxID=101571 RepID=UPI0005D8651B|nr:AAA family ATPase [Burkholderia ubonensis]AJX17069.1 4Fe-4S iron sulfur cluster binding s, NifH/frxC family protein [Burkholderia ubonensis MSMB22]
MSVRLISVFNNKGGVGKTTLSFHLAHALAELGHRVLAVDLDPQCNLSIYSLTAEQIQSIWDAENQFIDEPGFESARKTLGEAKTHEICSEPRTIHFILKPTEEGTGELTTLPPPLEIAENLHLIPGRLTLHMYEEALARRWSDAFVGQPLAIRTLSEIRRVILQYAEDYDYDYAIIDTSPSLGQLNKTILTTVDAFLIPCAPDLFSLYGIRNIGNSLTRWHQELKTLYQLIPPTRRPFMPEDFVGFLGYTIYNAKKREGSTPWDMAIAHYDYAKKVPQDIASHIPRSLSDGLSSVKLKAPIGGLSVMHTHNTYPAHAQKYHIPMWKLPEYQDLDQGDTATVMTNKARYTATQDAYHAFASDVVARMELLQPKEMLRNG